MKKLNLLLTIITLIPGLVFAAGAILTPTELKGGEIITAEQAKALLDKKSASFIDTRSALNYGKGHVPTAIIIPYKGKSERVKGFDMSKDNFPLDKLPRDKKFPIVFYSHGDTGWKSYKAAVTAIKGGYTNVKWMRDGLASWKEKGNPLEN